MTPAISPSRNPNTVHGVYSRESVSSGRITDACPQPAKGLLIRNLRSRNAKVGGRGRRLADPYGSSLRRLGAPHPACRSQA